jgi:carbon monoxide dehydrogenase subunit G
MELTHGFTVPGPVEETWERFGDIASLAECFPGAQVTSVTDDSFEGTVKVKLGPIALTYAGSGSFVSKDEAAHSFVVEAKGRDKRGNGTAGATVTVSMSAGSGAADSTDVEVKTDLSITGKPAQFGRGVMQDVSDKLLGQFVACLEQTSGLGVVDQDAGPASVPTGAAATAAPGEDQDAGPSSAPPPEPAGAEGSTSAPAGAEGSMSAPAGVAQPTAAPTTIGGTPAAPPADDALDLGATVLPVLVKSYWKQAAIGAVVLAILVWLIRKLT